MIPKLCMETELIYATLNLCKTTEVGKIYHQLTKILLATVTTTMCEHKNTFKLKLNFCRCNGKSGWGGQLSTVIIMTIINIDHFLFLLITSGCVCCFLAILHLLFLENNIDCLHKDSSSSSGLWGLAVEVAVWGGLSVDNFMPKTMEKHLSILFRYHYKITI